MRARAAAILGIAVAGIVVRFAAYLVAGGAPDPMAHIQALCVWDCGWYRIIAETGYDLAPNNALRPAAANWAFFPLSPLIAGLLSRITTLPAVVCGFLLSNLYAVIAAFVSRPVFGANERAYWLFVVMLLAGPFSVLFSSLHTEALFILLSTLAFVSLREHRSLRAGLATAALSATRLTGILMVLAMGMSAIQARLKDGARLRELPRDLLADPRLILGLAVAPIGLFAYMAFIRLHTGDGLAFLHIQHAWGRSIGNPFESLGILLRLQFPLTPAGMVVATWAAAGAIGLALSLALAVRGRWPEAVFCAACILVSLAGGTTSMVRFVAGLAPLGWVAAELLSLSGVLYFAAFPIVVAAGFFVTIGWLNSSLFAM